MTEVSPVQMDAIRVAWHITPVGDVQTFTTVLQAGKGVGMIRILGPSCLGSFKMKIIGLAGPEMTKIISKKEDARINVDPSCFMGTATDRA